MRKFLTLTSAVVIMGAVSTPVYSQHYFDSYDPDDDYWVNQELTREGWNAYRERATEPMKFSYGNSYSREQYKELLNTLTETETKCFNVDENSMGGTARMQFGDYLLAFRDLYAMYKDENTPLKVKKEFEITYLDPRGNPKLLQGCPPKKILRFANEIEPAPKRDLQAEFHNQIYAYIDGILNKTPQSGYGFRSTGTGETYAGQSDSTLRGYRVGGGVNFYGDASTAYRGRVRLGIEASYENTDGTSVSQVENGTDTTGIVYNNDEIGSTGLNIGNRGLDVKVETKREAINALLKWVVDNHDKVNLYVGAETEISETTHRAQVSTPSFADISSQSRQEISNDYIGALIGAEANYELGPKWSARAKTEASIGGIFSSLDSSQTNMCGLCGPAEQNFTVNIKDKKSETAAVFKAALALIHQVSETVELSVEANATWRSKEGYARNPESGDDLFIDNNPTHLEFDNSASYRLGVKISKEW